MSKPVRPTDIAAPAKGAKETVIPAGKRKAGAAFGVVKFFNADKGYGFVAPEGDGNDGFVHISAVERIGMMAHQNQRVSYYIDNDQRSRVARESVTGSFGLPNGDRITTVRRDIMDRALRRSTSETDE